jgi:hypothetical protein
MLKKEQEKEKALLLQREEHLFNKYNDIEKKYANVNGEYNSMMSRVES